MSVTIKNLLGTRGGPQRDKSCSTLKRAFSRMVIGSTRIPRARSRTISEVEYNANKELIEHLESKGAILVDRSDLSAQPIKESKAPAPKPAPVKVEPAPEPVKAAPAKEPEVAEAPEVKAEEKAAPAKKAEEPKAEAKPEVKAAPKKAAPAKKAPAAKKATPSPRAAAKKKAAEAKASKGE